MTAPASCRCASAALAQRRADRRVVAAAHLGDLVEQPELVSSSARCRRRTARQRETAALRGVAAAPGAGARGLGRALRLDRARVLAEPRREAVAEHASIHFHLRWRLSEIALRSNSRTLPPRADDAGALCRRYVEPSVAQCSFRKRSSADALRSTSSGSNSGSAAPPPAAAAARAAACAAAAARAAAVELRADAREVGGRDGVARAHEPLRLEAQRELGHARDDVVEPRVERDEPLDRAAAAAAAAERAAVRAGLVDRAHAQRRAVRLAGRGRAAVRSRRSRRPRRADARGSSARFEPASTESSWKRQPMACANGRGGARASRNGSGRRERRDEPPTSSSSGGGEPAPDASRRRRRRERDAHRRAAAPRRSRPRGAGGGGAAAIAPAGTREPSASNPRSVVALGSARARWPLGRGGRRAAAAAARASLRGRRARRGRPPCRRSRKIVEPMRCSATVVPVSSYGSLKSALSASAWPMKSSGSSAFRASPARASRRRRPRAAAPSARAGRAGP